MNDKKSSLIIYHSSFIIFSSVFFRLKNRAFNWSIYFFPNKKTEIAKSVLPVNIAAKMPVAAAPTDQPKNGTIQKTAVQQSDNIKQVQPTIGFQFVGKFIYIMCIFLEFE